MLSVTAAAQAIQSPGPREGPLELSTGHEAHKNKEKRQAPGDTSSGFLSPFGLTPACSQGVQYQLMAGELLDFNSNRLVSVDPGVSYISLSNFLGGSITTTFQITDGVLYWLNSTFYNGSAGFCVLESIIYATFTAQGGPLGCVPVNLVTYSGA